MRLAEAIKGRFTEDPAARYAAEADRQGVAISTYIRERLEAADNRSEELAGV